MKKLVLGSLSAVLLASSMTATAMDAEDAIQFRQAGYKFMAWNMAKIKAMAIDGSAEWNPAQVQAAANSIAATANSGMGALFIPGTEADVGDTKTRVKPEMFSDIEGVTEVGMAFHKAANELAAAAETGDKAAVAKAFGATGQSCKGCHDKFRKD
ncbi:MAG: cytochrome c [Gammaproteobacteria bacterium]|nr:cytochrome c [Gammaproteobacteria bacterium]